MKCIAIIRAVVTAVIVAWHLVRFEGIALADGWPMLGRDGTRNSVSAETGAPMEWSVESNEGDRVIRESRGIRWSAMLGSETHSSPVVSDGLVWIGTNNVRRDADDGEKFHSVLKCFRVTDGKLVYEYISPRMGTRIQDAGWTGLGSSPLIEGDRLWLTTNRSDVLCWDIGPVIRDEGTPRELWKLDLIKAFDTFPHVPLMGPSRPCSIGASFNGRIFVTTNNGVAEDRTSVPKPDAANLVCLNKDTGEIYWKDSSPGSNILMTQLSSPTVAAIRGEVQVIVPQSDGWVRAFDPMTGEKLWEFDINAKEAFYSLGGRSSRNSLLGNAVVYEDRVYVASGMDVEHGEGPGRLVCIDPTKRGDVSSELAVDADGKPLPRRRLQAVNSKAGEKAIPNPNSALVWDFISCGKEFEDSMHGTIGSAAIAKGLVIVGDFSGVVHCLDAGTGQRHWSYDTFAGIWASPLIVDDRVYVADEDGEVAIFGLSANPDIALRKEGAQRQPLAEIPMDNPIRCSPVFANGVLYIARSNTLFAIAGDQVQSDPEWKVDSWPQWRGPNRDNHSPEKGLLGAWPEAGPPLRWRVDGVGEGIASVSIASGRIYTLGYFEDGEYLTALDQRTAERVWATRVGPRVNENSVMRWLSQRAPTLDGDRLYAITTGGRLVCLQTRDGRELWSRNYPDDFGSPRPTWGFCDYPFVDGERLICTPGGPLASVVALDKRTGRELWRSLVPNGGQSAYAALVVAEVGGIRQYVVFLEKVLVGLRADDGRLLWRYDRIANRTANSQTPVVRGEHLLTGNGYSTGLAVLKLTVEGDHVAAKEQSFQRLSLDNFQDSLLVVGDHLFAGTGTVLMCVDWKSGNRIWAARNGRVAFLHAEDRLYLRNSDGRVTLADATTAEYVERGSFQIPDAVKGIGATAPVIAGGRLYLRDENKLLCYDIRDGAQLQSAAAPQLVVLKAPVAGPATETRERTLRSVFVPTPQDVVEKMLELAEVHTGDVVNDLGSGDGRIVITAARKYGCRAVGYELDRELVESSLARADAEGLKSLVTIELKDLFTADLRDADVIAVFLLPQQLEKLLPQLEKMKPGSRIVSHQFEIPGVPPEKSVQIESAADGAKHTLYLWTLPLKKANE